MSQAGKGDRDRTTDKKAYDAGIDRIDWNKKKNHIVHVNEKVEHIADVGKKVKR
jgi:hypothetical protein